MSAVGRVLWRFVGFVALALCLALAWAIPASAAGATDDFSGQWEVIGTKGKPYIRLELSQTGRDITGRAYYDKGSAKVTGEVSGGKLKLKIIYDNARILEKWLPPKVARQVIGIYSPMEFDIVPGAESFKGTFESFYVWWDANKNVTKRADGGSPAAKAMKKPYPQTLRRLGGRPTSPAGGGRDYQDDKGNKVRVRCEKSFADRIIDYRIGSPKPEAKHTDPRTALGPPDFDAKRETGYVSLGCGGSLTLYFSNVDIVDIDGPDLYIFEIGKDVEPTKVELSRDGRTWIDAGRAGGGTGSVDIGPYVRPGDRFKYVRLTDLRSACKGGWPGADIDAVAAIGCVSVPTSTPTPPPAGATGDFSGQWEMLDAKGKPYIRLELSQTGRDITGRAYYDKGSAKVTGEVSGGKLKLKIIYDNARILEKWLPPKVARQVIGIYSPMEFDIVPGAESFKGTFESFYVWWDANKNVTKRADGGSPAARAKNKPHPRTLRRLGGRPTPPTGGPARLWLEKSVFRPGERITVHFTAPAGYDANAWVGIIPSRVRHGSGRENDKYDLDYKYLNQRTSGRLTFTAPAKPGDYDFRMHDTDRDGREVASVSFRVVKSGRPTPPPQTGVSPGPTPPSGFGRGPQSLIAWIEYIKSGRPFLVVFDTVGDKFDDEGYTGDWRTDPMGTLKAGQTYRVVYSGGKFTCTGFNEHDGRRSTYVYSNADPDDALISLWGRVYAFDGRGRVWDLTYGLVGHLRVPAGPGGASLGPGRGAPPGGVLAQKKIPPSGGTITVAKPGDPLDGLKIEIPAGAYPETRTFTITRRPVPPAARTSSWVHPITPLIEVDNGGGYAEELMVVRIPARIAPGRFAMPFFYDPATGRLEGMPVVEWDESGLTAVTRHFSSFFVSDVAVEALDRLNRVESGFTPGRDNWGFINEGSYLSPGGICSGMAMTAMWYYLERYKQTKQGLQRRFDNAPRAFATPKLGADDSTGIRWASVVQRDQVGYSKRAGIEVISEWQEKAPQKLDEGVWYCFVYSMLVTREPQYVSIWGQDETSGEWYGHALAAYAVDMTTGRLSVYDPNYDPSSGREIEFDQTRKRFKKYLSALNAKELKQGNGLPFKGFCYFAKSAVVDWKLLASRWKQVEAKTIGRGLFPAYHWEVVDEKGRSQGRIKGTYTTVQDKIRLSIEPDGDTRMSFATDFWRASLAPAGDTRASAKLTKFKVKVENGVAEVPLQPGLNWIGVEIWAATSKGDIAWAGFDWFRIQRGRLTITPARVKGVVGIPISFTAAAEIMPAGAGFSWDWGDGARTGTGERNAAAHVWSKPGRYTAVVSLIDQASGRALAQAEAQVTIEAVAGGTEPPPPADGCPDDLLKWCRERNFKPLKCLKCRVRTEPIGKCEDCAFPRVYKGEGLWTAVGRASSGANREASCPRPVQVTLKLEPAPSNKALILINGASCPQIDDDRGAVCERCGLLVFRGRHDAQGRFTITDKQRRVSIKGTFGSQSLEGGGSWRFSLGGGSIDERIEFKLKRVK